MRGDGSNTEHRIATYGIWIPGVAYPGGIAVIVFNFYDGVAVISIALITIIIVLFFIFPTERSWIIAGIMISVAVYGTTIWFIWFPAKTNVHGTLTYVASDFGENVDIYGIKWKRRYSAIVLNLENIGDHDFTNIDAYVWVDAQIVESGMANGINTCTWENYPNAPGAASLQVTNIEGLSAIYLPHDKW